MTSHPKMQTLRAEVALSVAGCFAPSCCPYLGLHSVMVLANKWIGDKGDFDFKGQHGPSLWYFKFLQVSDDSIFPGRKKTDCPSLMWWTFYFHVASRGVTWVFFQVLAVLGATSNK